jgi:Fe-S cluster biogenesis protein NfuA
MTVEEQIESVIRDRISPALATHGGDAEFVEFDQGTGTAKVRLTGACGGCPFAAETLRMQVESVLQSEIPQLKAVVRA